MTMNLSQKTRLFIYQRRELAELFGFETRNKYEILDEDRNTIGFCAEQQKGLLGFLFRQFLGHWRSFELHFFDNDKNLFMKSEHPFRFFFQEFTIFDFQNNKIGRIQQRFGILTKKFDVYDAHENIILKMRSGFFSIWTFPFESLNGTQRAVIKKKWSGFLKEIFLDADNFLIEFTDFNLSDAERKIILAASVFTDLQYFERKAK